MSRKDVSISPMTQSPWSESPSQLGHNAVGVVTRQSGLRSEIRNNSVESPQTPAKLEALPVVSSNASNHEANDYMNNGVPHGTRSTPSQPPAPSRRDDGSKVTPGSLSGIANNMDSRTVGTSTPPGRRSVQFARADTGSESMSQTRQESWGQEEGENPAKDRKGLSLMSKLKALTAVNGSQPHTRNQSGGSNSLFEMSASAPQSPTDRSTSRIRDVLREEGSDEDADAEETADEGTSTDNAVNHRKRRFRRKDPDTAPSTPRARPFESLTSSGSRPNLFIRRRSTMPEDGEEQQGGLSEGEGRDRLGRQPAWRRGSAWMSARGQSFGANGHDSEGRPSSSRKPGNIRRMNGLGGNSDGDEPKRPLSNKDRATTYSAQKWKAFKQSIKILGQKKEEHKVDYLKSTELMAELRAGAPAALMLASMIQRDEHGNRRIPVLLEQLKTQITDSRRMDTSKDGKDEREGERHLIFRIEMEYGSGTNRMKWLIHRTLRDFINLHLRYKLQATSDKYVPLRGNLEGRSKQPRFPRSSFPYMRGVRGLGDSDDEEPEIPRIDDHVGEATQSEAERPNKRKKRPDGSRRMSSVFGPESALASIAGIGGQAAGAIATSNARKAYNERQRRKLEQYLHEMIRWLMFRADSNRLCRFLELSALGVRLAAEGGFHGKEGFLVIQSVKGMDFRKILTPHNMYDRHSPKWFLVRHSYIVCVESPENMHIYDVFLIDSHFEIGMKRTKFKDASAKEIAVFAKHKTTHPQHHTMKLRNSERKIKLLAKNERQLRQFEDSIQTMLDASLWSKPNRFDSFAPVRTGVSAQWLVDGRDYMWSVSNAIDQAKDVIYIHDWWLSPQLYMRRPAAVSQKWRLDRLLRKKAREGVKIFIIIYRNVEAAIPIDSEYTKFAMLDLHPNVFVQRSPNQFKKSQFFFAHHEKICIVDNAAAFVGGVDLCFGRWDTPQHALCDDKPTGFDEPDQKLNADNCQLWIGKDYSNPRVKDFHDLDKPYLEMYDRELIPRMPWHDVAMQVMGQPARDLTRHFVQRWNYVLRGRKPTRPTPFLLPPPDYVPADIEALGLSGTCEVQMLRSACNWSLGLEKTEHSIMNAYCKMIEESEHFVYFENQFFITSCETMNISIVNKIGDAIVERAIRAFKGNEGWRCVIVIPLVPGFQNTVDESEGSSVRIIMQCQFRSICRGENSIFGRLKKEGIEPEEFISFYSLRTWGKMGATKILVTEQLYIHAKVLIVDDRIALIGSANVNERSMLGSRDSECACVVRDTDMIWSTMDGEPYLVGRFAHTLRMRLMREHLGIHVDEIMEDERRDMLDQDDNKKEDDMERIYNDGVDDDTEFGLSPGMADQLDGLRQSQEERKDLNEKVRSFNHDVDWEQEDNPNLVSDKMGVTSDKRVTGNKKHAAEVDGEGADHWKAAEISGAERGRDSVIVDGVREILAENIADEGKGSLAKPQRSHSRHVPGKNGYRDDSPGPGYMGMPPPPQMPRRTTEQLGLSQLSQLPALPISDDTDIGGPPVRFDAAGNPVADFYSPLASEIKRAVVERDCMRDPLNDSFFEDTWKRIADNNTKIFRLVFRCNPDSEVQGWHDYTEFVAYAERFSQAQGGGKSTDREEQEATGKSGPPGAAVAGSSSGGGGGPIIQGISKMTEKVPLGHSRVKDRPLGTVEEWADEADAKNQVQAEKPSIDVVDDGDEADYMDEKSTIKTSNESQTVVAPPSETHEFPSLESSLTETTGGGIIEHDRSGAVAAATTEKSADDRRRTTFSTQSTERGTTGTGNGSSGAAPGSPSNYNQEQQPARRRRRGTTRASRRGFSSSDDLLTRQEAEELLGMVQGHLVNFPYDWLVKEEFNSNWLYQVDQVAPLQIYN